MDMRQRLVMAHGVDHFRQTLLGAAKELAHEQNQWRETRKNSIHFSEERKKIVRQKMKRKSCGQMLFFMI